MGPNTPLTVCNVKGRFSVRAPKYLLFNRIAKPSTGRLATNFSFVALNGLKYSVFANSTSVNVTGLTKFSDLGLAAETFCRHFGVALEPLSKTIDNSTVVGELIGVNRELLTKVASREAPKEEADFDDVANAFVVVARTRWFPSIHLRPNKNYPQWVDESEPNVLASCTVFPTGKIVILGAKCIEDAEYTARTAAAFLFRDWGEGRSWNDEYFYGECGLSDSFDGQLADIQGAIAVDVAERTCDAITAAGFLSEDERDDGEVGRELRGRVAADQAADGDCVDADPSLISEEVASFIH